MIDPDILTKHLHSSSGHLKSYSGDIVQVAMAMCKSCTSCVTAVQFILIYFANYSPSIAMEFKVGKEITCKWQNQRYVKYVPWTLFLKLQTAELNFG